MLHDLWKALVTAMASWHQGKLFIEHSLTIDHNSLHIFVGVLLWLALGLLFRRPLTSWRPWLWLFAVILWNETVYLWVEQWPDPGHQYVEGANDPLLTVAGPTIFFLAARFPPALFRAG